MYLGSSLKDEVTVSGWARGRRAKMYNVWDRHAGVLMAENMNAKLRADPHPRKAYKLILVRTVKKLFCILICLFLIFNGI